MIDKNHINKPSISISSLDDEKGDLLGDKKSLKINNELKTIPQKFNVNGVEFWVVFSITMFIHLYNLVLTSAKTQRIQNETPLIGVVSSWFGFWRDDSDSQWSKFRQNLILFIPGMLMFVFLGRIIRSIFSQQYKQRFLALRTYYLITGCLFLVYLFEGGFILWIFFTSSNYLMQKFLYKYKFYPIILWTFSICSLYYIYFYHGQPFQILSYIFPAFGTHLLISSDNSLIAWYAVQNMTMLRVMSYCLDKHWSYRKLYQFDQKKHLQRCDQCGVDKTCLKARIDKSLEPKEYDTISNYYAYLMYLPLFITGPQVTFNAFISQIYISQNVISKKTTIIYFIRAIGKLMEIEIYSHLNFASALSKIEENKPHWIQFTIIECLFMGMLNIFFIWLKFLAIWRLARSFSLFDGIDCPENMEKCLFTGYGFEEFWRQWHRGFNQWLIRYLFIPLGGSKTKVWNVWVVFTFVAIWHDFQLDLVIWAWFICAALIPEMLLSQWGKKQYFLWTTWWFKYGCIGFGSLIIWLMLIANLIGFGSGWHNAQIIISKISDPGSYVQILTAWISTTSYTLLQFYIKDIQANQIQTKKHT